jgi:hypothetical protein
MIFVLTETWPAAASAEVAKESVKLAATPPQNMKMLGPYVVMGGDGVKDYTVYEVEKGQADKALAEILGRLSGLFRIPGYRASLEVAITQIEALPLVGM